MCDKKNSVFFTESECLILSLSFKLLDESQVILRAPRKDDVYNLDLKNIISSGGNSPSISFMRPFGCPLTILNTLDSLGKFDGKSNEGYLLGYSTTSKAFRVYNKRTKRVEENLHINFLEDQPNMTGTGPNWMFDLDFLTNSMNYIPVSVENQVNVDAEDVANKEGTTSDDRKRTSLCNDDLRRGLLKDSGATVLDDATRQRL
ncbi:ribonuclease H-like domain-containing protein [Tanacetum coccineum]|uniref:Ribonuclease H-like domain-containing protein n=1 Tax=Tanacetum coccineum TaxID=301880 RepID=A0ABQ4ZKP5_9ASTR